MSCCSNDLVETSSHRPAFLARAIPQVTLALLLGAASRSSALPAAADLTDLSIAQLANVRVAQATTKGAGTIVAIRAGCSDGPDICDALHEVLAGAKRFDETGSGRTARASTNVRLVTSAETQEYNRPSLNPGVFASPSDMGFGHAPTVVGAMRALGFGSDEPDDRRVGHPSKL